MNACWSWRKYSISINSGDQVRATKGPLYEAAQPDPVDATHPMAKEAN